MRIWSLAVVSFLLAACPGSEPEALEWYTTCGDPVCRGYSGPFEGVPLCTTEAEGDPCEVDGGSCDPENDCNSLLVCASEDPKDQTGGCPISQREVKRDVTYLDAPELEKARSQAMDLRLATWRYRWETGESRPHLGFVIDDHPASPAIRADGERVDLYGYTSLAIAAAQAQQAEIDALRAELEALKARVERCEGR